MGKKKLVKNEGPPSPPAVLQEHLSLASPGSAGPGGGSVTRGKLKLEKHCLICLQPQTLQTLLEVDESCPELRKDLKALIYYLTGTDPNQTSPSEEVVGFQNEDGGRDPNNAGIWMMNVPKLPPMMCPSCHDILWELYRLHRELLRTQWLIQKQTELAREIVTNKAGDGTGSSSLSRQLFYSKIESSGIPTGEADDIIKFVEELHTKIFVADSQKQKVTFPSSPPPYFVPEAGSKSKSANSSSWLPLQLPNGSIRLSRCDRDTLSKTREPATTLIHSDKDPDDVVRPGDDDNDIGMPSPSSEPHEDPAIDGSPSEDDDADPSNSNPVKNEKRKRRQRPSEPDDDDDDDDEYVPPPTKKVPKAKPAPETETGPNRLSYTAYRSLVETEAGTSQHCDLCGELVPSPDIQSHLESQHHVQDFISKCPNPSCPCVFSCDGKLQRHLRHGSSKYTCRRVAKLTDKPRQMKCDSCRFRTFSETQFRKHLQKHEAALQDSARAFQCPLPGCHHGFARKQTLEEHIYSHNPGEKEKGKRQRGLLKSKLTPTQECDLCGVSIPCSEMVAHLEGHSPQLKDYIRKCLNPACPHVFSCVGKMESHVRCQKRIILPGGQVAPGKGSMSCRRAANISPGVPILKCDTCLEMVTSRTAFQNHLEQHESLDPDKQEKSLTCPMPDCDNLFALRQSVEEHLMLHDLRPQRSPQDGLQEQECSVCKEMIPVGEISEHFGESHGVVETISCRNCPFLFHSWESLLDHLYEHRLGSSIFGMICDMCGDENLRFRRYESLRQHFFNVHQVGTKLTCEECYAEFFSKDRLSHHKEWSHSTDPSVSKPEKKMSRPVQCDQCPDSFPYKYMMLNHKIKVHGAPPIKCKFCEQEFISVHTCQTHELTHLGPKPTPTFTCSVEGCGRVFKSRIKWRRHEKGAHLPDTSPKLFVCETCGAGYNLEHSFKTHMKTHVKKENPGEVKSHICEICGQKLASSDSLRRHKLIHSEERPHSCHICGQRFRQVGVMRVHLRMHEEKGDSFRPSGEFNHVRKRV